MKNNLQQKLLDYHNCMSARIKNNKNLFTYTLFLRRLSEWYTIKQLEEYESFLWNYQGNRSLTKKLTESEIKWALEMKKNKYKNSEIAKRYNVSSSYIYYHLNELSK